MARFRGTNGATVNIDPESLSETARHIFDGKVARGQLVPVDGATTTEQLPDATPEGTIAQIMSWVGDNPERAQAALDTECAGQNRKTLIDQLSTMLGD